jgi:hypothetical protein
MMTGPIRDGKEADPMPATTCGYCGAYANMTEELKPTKIRRDTFDYDPFVAMAVYRCDSCHSLMLAAGEIVDSRGLDEREAFETSELTWIPPSGLTKAFEDVPEHVAEAASEAYKCLGLGALRGAVQLARSVVEATAKEKGITSGRLVEKIDKMYSEGLIREHIKEGAHEVRYLGNDMAHGDFIVPVTKEEAEETVGLMAEVLEEVFQSPARVARRQASRQAKHVAGGS